MVLSACILSLWQTYNIKTKYKYLFRDSEIFRCLRLDVYQDSEQKLTKMYWDVPFAKNMYKTAWSIWSGNIDSAIDVYIQTYFMYLLMFMLIN